MNPLELVEDLQSTLDRMITVLEKIEKSNQELVERVKKIEEKL